MKLSRGLATALAVPIAAISLAIPAIAGANTKAGQATYQQTYPVASKLCDKVVAGTENKHLKKFAAAVTVDCTTLQGDFTAAQSTVNTTRAALEAQIAADRALIAAACPTPLHQPKGCKKTRETLNDAIRVLHKQERNAARHYYRVVEASRDRYWRAIHSLPGEHHVRADTPIDVHQTV